MAIGNLIPWNRDREVATRRGDEASPFLELHRQVNRLFDDVAALISHRSQVEVC